MVGKPYSRKPSYGLGIVIGNKSSSRYSKNNEYMYLGDLLGHEYLHAFPFSNKLMNKLSCMLKRDKWEFIEFLQGRRISEEERLDMEKDWTFSKDADEKMLEHMVNTCEEEYAQQHKEVSDYATTHSIPFDTAWKILQQSRTENHP